VRAPLVVIGPVDWIPLVVYIVPLDVILLVVISPEIVPMPMLEGVLWKVTVPCTTSVPLVII
jgi:hypothetical protein